MSNQRNRFFILLIMITSLFLSCNKKWDQHDAINDSNLTINVFQQISNQPSLSVFSQYLVKSGYDKILSSSKSFTVWAPNNAAMQNVSQSILTDSAKLSQFIGNHISYQLYSTTTPADTALRVAMLNGKSETFTKSTIEAATILQANLYASNGILHIINKGILPKLNIWDYVTNTGAANGNGLTTMGLNEQSYLLTQNYQYQDTTKAVIIGIDPKTGKPIPQPGTGIVYANTYEDKTVYISDETKQFTFFVLADAGFTNEIGKVVKYFNTSSLDSTNKAASYNVLKDLVVNGVYSTKGEPGTKPMPDTLTSIYGVKIPINMNDTLASFNASNGRVYIMKDVYFRVQDKITPFVIQGESEPAPGQPGSWFRTTVNSQNIYYRIKNDLLGVQFKDIYCEYNTANNTFPAQFWAGYPIQNLNSATYKVYIRAINDSKLVFNEMISFNGPYTGTIPYFPVALNNYAEVYLGNYTNSKYGYNSMFVVGANVSSTTGLNSITFDYIKLVPILQ